MPDPTEADFEAILTGIAHELDVRELPYMLIGGQAVLLHGEPRLTQDIDVTLGVDPSQLHALLARETVGHATPPPSPPPPPRPRMMQRRLQQVRRHQQHGNEHDERDE